MTSRRVGGMGQLDYEMEYGPSPIDMSDVPVDLRPRYITDGKGGLPGTGAGAGEGADLNQIARDVHSIAGTLVLRRGLLGRVVTVTSSPQLIISAQEDRGYLLLNPTGVVGLTAQGTVFSSTTLVGATTLLSGGLGVANYNTGRFFLKVTAMAGVGPVTFDLQTLDPVDGTTYITSQTIFSVAAVGNTYASVGQLGIDVDAKILVTVPVGTTITFTLGFVLKDGLEGTSAGATQTIFIGGGGVSTISGYPILAGREKSFYLLENVSLYAVTSGPSLDMNIFEL
jgi:hypothetical protein